MSWCTTITYWSTYWRISCCFHILTIINKVPIHVLTLCYLFWLHITEDICLILFVSFHKKLPNCFPKWCYHFAFLSMIVPCLVLSMFQILKDLFICLFKRETGSDSEKKLPSAPFLPQKLLTVSWPEQSQGLGMISWFPIWILKTQALGIFSTDFPGASTGSLIWKKKIEHLVLESVHQYLMPLSQVTLCHNIAFCFRLAPGPTPVIVAI